MTQPQKSPAGTPRPQASEKTRRLVRIALIAALYAAITFATFFMSFGAVQYRVSEMLTVLPVFTGLAVPGLSFGCATANLVGFLCGANPIGWMDAIFGTAATLLAALCTLWIGKSRHAWVRYGFGPLPPVVFNGIIVGLELMFLYGPVTLPSFLLYAGSVALGEAVVCYVLGVPLMLVLSRKELYRKIFF